VLSWPLKSPLDLPDLPDLELATSFDGFQQQDSIPWEEFFTQSDAFPAPKPCDYCRKHRLQCLILRTSYANPNPEHSCSTCVGLYRGCSLAKGRKREAAAFETSGPVIGQLHGVNEEIDPASNVREINSEANGLCAVSPPAVYDRDKRPSSRRYQKTKILRSWFDTHAERPYPTPEDLEFLSSQSGLTKTQVGNWFTNARRRQRQTSRPLSSRHFRSGSPMPQPTYSSSPIERWRNSPPEDDHVSMEAVAAALESNVISDELSQMAPPLPPSARWSLSDMSSQADTESTSASSLSSCLSSTSFHRIGIRPRSQRSSRRNSAKPIYQCTFCHAPFKKKHDWARHERAVHMPELETYTCLPPNQLPNTGTSQVQDLQIWRFDSPAPQCMLCGHSNPSDEHFESHSFESCAERPSAQRTFTRKDHFWQHLAKYHACLKWDGWDIDLDSWRASTLDHNSSSCFACGFCHFRALDWKARVDHVAQHFRDGLTMDNWLD
jgi:hypothetical protein